MKSYGKELILDLHNCNPELFTRESIGAYFDTICDLLGVEVCDRHFWDDVDTPEEEKQTDPRLVGTSAVQFILTSNITIHTLDLLKTVYVNIFSCADFDIDMIAHCTQDWFEGHIVTQMEIPRQ